MAEIKTLIDKTFFFFISDEGKPCWSLKDPSVNRTWPDSIVSIEDEISSFLGEAPKAGHPAKVRVKAAFGNRTQEFDISVPGKVRKGHGLRVCDLENRLVEFAETRSPDPDFPLNGMVFDGDGNPVGFRRYNGRGECSDGNPDHSLYVIVLSLQNKQE